jgi:hypothetical protein
MRWLFAVAIGVGLGVVVGLLVPAAAANSST